MKFVPVPGTAVLFGVWDTRVQDYRVFAEATATAWPAPDFPQGPTHPAVNMSWEEAKAFCVWLTARERQAGRLGPDQAYRLPTDAEWSVAAGLPPEAGHTPAEKNAKVAEVYPWGTQWPPPRVTGNYRDATHQRKYRTPLDAKPRALTNYDDGYADTSPVGVFAANQFGLYDMSGNIWQLCEDAWDDTGKYRVMRGGSAYDRTPNYLLSSYRNVDTPVGRDPVTGFRCVVGPVAPAR